MRTRETSLADRLSTAAKATQARIERARAGDPSTKAGFAEQQEARLAAAAARDARLNERREEKQAADAQKESERVARKAAEEADATARNAALEAERKVVRDARYAARKARTNKGPRG